MQIGMLIVINLVIGFGIGGVASIDNAAHIGGLLAGAWLGSSSRHAGHRHCDPSGSACRPECGAGSAIATPVAIAVGGIIAVCSALLIVLVQVTPVLGLNLGGK